jgi:TRAP-type mannitol/chloroaromatic compound transport system permease small subunit
MNACAGLFRRLTAVLAGAGSVWIVLVMFLVCADVAGRYLMNRPIEGVAELVALSIVGIVFLQLAHTLSVERFIRSDVFILPLLQRKPRAGYALQGVQHLIGGLLCLMMLVFVAPVFVEAWTEGEYVGTAGVFTAPKWPVHFIVCLGAGLTAIQYFLHTWRDARVALGHLPPPVLSEEAPRHD